MSYPVYRVASAGMPMDHHAIFIELDSHTGSGQIFQVTGNIQAGMSYETKAGGKPEEELGYFGKVLVGRVAVGDYEKVGEVCADVEVPGKQFDGPRRLVPAGVRLRRCQEWTEEALGRLREEGVLV